MAENVFSTMNIAGQGMSVQRKRLSAIANNIANVNTTKGLDGLPYRREIVVSHNADTHSFANQLGSQIELSRTNMAHAPNTKINALDGENRSIDVETTQAAEERLVYEPNHPDADSDGYVHYPDINIVTEMVDMITAQRGFEANTQSISTAKNIARFSLEI